MKYREIVNVKPWKADDGFSCESTIANEIIDLEEPSFADPAAWWVDYCNGNRQSGVDDQLVIVKIYAADDEDCEEPIYSAEAWESDMTGWNPVTRYEISAIPFVFPYSKKILSDITPEFILERVIPELATETQNNYGSLEAARNALADAFADIDKDDHYIRGTAYILESYEIEDGEEDNWERIAYYVPGFDENGKPCRKIFNED